MNFVEFLKVCQSIETRHGDHYGEWVGYDVVDYNTVNNETTTVLEIRNDHLSPSGSVHGGVISGFMDMSCGSAAFTSLEKGQLCSTVELNFKYFEPLRSGDKVSAKSKLVNRGKTLCSVLSHMYIEGQERPVALATGTFNIYSIEKALK